VAEDQELASGAGFAWPPGDAEMIAAKFLDQPLDPSATLAPFNFEKAATTVGGAFLKAWGLSEHEPSENSQHLRQQGF
jgi:hypothetical protein